MQDANYVPVLLGERPDGTVAPVKVTADGELVVVYVINGAVTTNQTPKEDANYVPVNMAEYNGSTTSLITDSSGKVIVSWDINF